VPLPFTALAQYIGERLSRYESAPTPKLSTAIAIGNYGERVAASFLLRHGYRVLTRNFKTAQGEIDLVCRHGEILVFVEVKSRADVDWVLPSEAIDERKEEALHATARRYLQLLGRDDITYRFDAVEVRLKPGEIPECTLIPNFFGGASPSTGPRFD
jgi:putative endonuclease